MTKGSIPRINRNKLIKEINDKEYKRRKEYYQTYKKYFAKYSRLNRKHIYAQRRQRKIYNDIKAMEKEK